MAEVVFILGAGASAHAGVPVMNEFYGAACDLCDDRKIGNYDKAFFNLIIDAIRPLESISLKLNIDVNNIEHIFSLIEMGKLINRFPGLDGDKIAELHEAIHMFIIRTIELKSNFTYKEDMVVCAPEAYDLLAQNISLLREQSGPSSSAVLTFNYDVAIDLALEIAMGANNIDYCLGNSRQMNESGGYKLLKLHGSLNWAKQNLNGHTNVIPVRIKDFIEHNGMVFRTHGERKERTFLTTRDVHPLKRKGTFRIEVGSKIDKLKWLSPVEGIQKLPLIVPPTWSKTEYHSILCNVWAQAAEEISEAKYIFIIGYSFPESDLFFRYLLGLGMLDIRRLKYFWVIDPEPKIGKKYESILGTSVQQKFVAHPEKFSTAVVVDKIRFVLRQNQLIDQD
jgi:hypothetical protein